VPWSVDGPVLMRARSLVRRWGVPALAVALTIAVHVLAARGSSTLVWGEDEAGPLANAYVIASAGQPWTLSKLAYYPGWSVVLAPLWWLTSDPGTVYRAAVGLSVASAVASVAPLAALARRVGVSAPVAVTVAAVVTMSPARTVMSNYVLIENFLVLMVAVTALAALRYAERPTAARALTLAGLAAYTFFTHGRAVPVAIATALVFGVQAWRRFPGARRGAVVTLVLSGLAYVVYTSIVGQIYASAAGRETSAFSTVAGANPVGVLRTVVGQLWYQFAAWLGLSFAGLAVVLRATVAEVRARRPGGATWATVSLGGTLALMALFLGRVLTDPAQVGRLDYWFYGRYLDPFMVPVAVLGLAALVAAGRRVPVRGVLLAGLTVTGLFVVVNLRQIDPTLTIAAINAPGLLVWQVVLGAIPRLATVLATTLLAATVLMLIQRSGLWRVLAVSGLTLFFAVSSVVVDARVVDHLSAVWLRSAALEAMVDEVDPDGTVIGYDMDGTLPAEDNRTTFWLSPRRVERFDSAVDPPPAPLVVSRWEWPRGEELGAVRVGSLLFPDNALWVMPGALQEALIAAGDAELTSAAPTLRSYAYDLTVTSGPAQDAECGHPWSQCGLTLAVTNRGRDAWSPIATLGTATGSVRVVAWWQSASATVRQVEELSRSVYPGETVSIEMDLDPPDGLGPGAATVEFGLVEEGTDGFPGPESELPFVRVVAGG